MKSYILELTNKDFEELEKVVMGCDGFDSKETRISRDTERNSVYVTFWEEIPPDDDEPEQEKCYAETRYVYYDFEPPDICDWEPFDPSEINAAYFKWMVDRFGEKYIKDYFEYHTGVKV